MSRNLIDVIVKMIKVLPEDGEEEMKKDLEDEMERVVFTAPENIYMKWKNVQRIVTERFKKHVDITTLPEWGVQLIEIWTNKKKE
jgi:hypothetical protein